MGTDLTAFAPGRCDRGHYLGLHGRRMVSYQPCDCPGVITDGTRSRGHVTLRCTACQDEGRDVVYYDPPHEPGSGR